MKERGKICVFGASSSRIDRTYSTAAQELGTLMAQHGWGCICGAGSEGLMRAVADGVLQGGGTVTGVIPKFMVDAGWAYDRLTETIVTADMHERKERMATMADAFIALPGGCGTIEELMEVFTWRQLGLLSKPIVLLSTLGFWEPLVAMVHTAVTQGFMKHQHEHLWTVVETPREAIAQIEKQLREGPVKAESKYGPDMQR